MSWGFQIANECQTKYRTGEPTRVRFSFEGVGLLTKKNKWACESGWGVIGGIGGLSQTHLTIPGFHLRNHFVFL